MAAKGAALWSCIFVPGYKIKIPSRKTRAEKISVLLLAQGGLDTTSGQTAWSVCPSSHCIHQSLLEPHSAATSSVDWQFLLLGN